MKIYTLLALMSLYSCGATYTDSDGNSVEVGTKTPTDGETSQDNNLGASDSTEDKKDSSGNSDESQASTSTSNGSYVENGDEEKENITADDNTDFLELAFDDWPEPEFKTIRAAKGGRQTQPYWDWYIEEEQASCVKIGYEAEQPYIDPVDYGQLENWLAYYCICYYEILATFVPVNEKDSNKLEWSEYLYEEGYSYSCMWMAEKSYPLYRADL